MSETEKSSEIAALTVELLSAYLSNNTVPSADLADLIQSTRAALAQDAAPEQPEAEKPTFTAAVSARKSLASPDHIISMIDGKPYKTLKRHLSANGLTPETYRERYGLPASYPMVAPTFTAMRREIAERIGLGNRNGAGVQAADEASSTSVDGTEAGAPVAPKPKKQAVKTPAVKATKAPARKTKTVRKSAAASPEAPATATAEAPVSASETPAKGAKAAEAAKPKKQQVKRMARTPKSAAKADEPAAPQTEAPAVEPTESPAAPKSANRRGKLGLFGKAGAGKAEAAPDASTPAADIPKRRWKRAGTAAS